MVTVNGSLYNGQLTGYGQYTDKIGNEWFATFHQDMKHGVCKVNQKTGTRQTGALVNGQYHGPLSFWFKEGKV